MRKRLVRPFLALLLVTLAVLLPAAAQGAPGGFLFQWGIPLLLPTIGTIAVDGAGNLYVTEANSVLVFDKNGALVKSFGSYGTGNGEFDHPEGIAVTDSRIYVLDSERVQAFDSSGNFIKTWGSQGTANGEFTFPEAVAVDKSGNVYVSDTYNSRIQVFDGNGNFIRAFGKEGRGDALLAYPTDLAVDSGGNVFVVDYLQIKVYDADGRFVRSWAPYGLGGTPSGIAVDGAGNVYIGVDPYSDFYPPEKVQVFDSSGNFLRQWGDFGYGDGEFYTIGDVAVDAAANVYVVDLNNKRVQIFDSGGHFLRKVGGINADGQFYFPTGVATDTVGNVYVADARNYRIQIFDSAGNFLRKFGSQGTANGQFADLLSIALDSSGNIYVGDAGGGELGHGLSLIQVFDNSGRFLRNWALPAGDYSYMTVPAGVAVDGGGNVYVSDRVNNRVMVFSGSGSLIRSWGNLGSGDGQLDGPIGLALDALGNVYVADSGNHRVQVFNGSGTFLRKWGSEGSGDGQFATPTGIAVDGSGKVHVIDIDLTGITRRIQVFDSAGRFLGKWGSAGSGDGQFIYPYGVAANLSGSTVYVSDANYDRISAFSGFGEQLPLGWIGRDVGSVGVPGRASYADGVYTLQGSGANIWGTADAFHFAYRPLTGDGEIVARVDAVQNTNGYAKGGVMMRETLAANSAHAMVDIMPSYGAEFSRRLSTGGSTTVTATAGVAAPYWVKLVRQGSSFSGYISSDGATWSLLGSSSITMAGSIYVGLIVNSHNNSALCTTTIDKVSLAGQSNTPSVAITAPANGATFNAPATIPITATAMASSGAVVKQVEFFAGSSIGSATTSPFGLTWSNVAAGSYSLSARVTDSFGRSAASAPVAVTVNATGLPAPWLTRDIGSVGVAGSASYQNGTFTVKGSGANIWGSADAFRFVYQPMTGDGQIVARVASIQNTNSYAKAGVMIRQALTANSMHAMVDITPTSGAEFSRRTTTGGSTTPTAKTGIAAPYWVKLVRSGNTFTGSVSSDGVSWVGIGSSTINMTGTVYIGLIVNSHNNAVTCTATLTNVTASIVDGETAPVVTAFSIPATSSSLTVPITTFTATDNVGVTGYLLTESSSKPSASASGWSATPPAAYTFASSGTKILYAWAKDAEGNVSNSRSATVSISIGGLPAPWLTQDIGSVGVIGSASYANGTFTLKGSGADIWGTADAFRFVYKVLTGDGQIIARVASLQNTNSYAKGGVMIRQSLAANSIHAMMDLRPTGGAEFSRRTSTGGTTTATTRTGISAPYWVRLVRSGNTFTGSVSSDGVNWTQVGSSSIAMTSSVYVGLIVNSHNNAVLCTTTIDDVK